VITTLRGKKLFKIACPEGNLHRTYKRHTSSDISTMYALTGFDSQPLRSILSSFYVPLHLILSQI